MIYCILPGRIFTVAQRERAQEDFKVPYEGAHLTHPPTIHRRKTATAPGLPYNTIAMYEDLKLMRNWERRI